MQTLTLGVELISKGGLIMIPLLLSALIALTVILERLFAFHRLYRTDPAIIQETFHHLHQGDLTKATSVCQKQQTPATSLLSVGIQHFHHPSEVMELVMKNQAEAWVPHLEKRIEIIDTVITAAPLMGLLGTITGMMSSFQVLSTTGINEPNAITGGVAEALIATATGLIIALICILAYNYLSSWVKSSLYELESLASRLLEAKLSFSLQQHPQTKTHITTSADNTPMLLKTALHSTHHNHPHNPIPLS